MMMRWILFAMAVVAASFAKADNLKHDPFSRPLLKAISVSGGTGISNTSAETPKVEQEQVWNPSLTAIMVAGKNSLVNVDGKLMRIGEELDGYRLVQVRDSEAVFYKEKKRIVLRMESSTKKDDKVRGRL